MVDLFSGKTLRRNTTKHDELDCERELTQVLQNKVVLLYFGSGECLRCQEFSPILKDFFVKLTDEFYVLRASQIVVVYISQDQMEKKQKKFLKDMPKKWLFLPFEDDFKRDLECMFNVDQIPTVVVVKPDGEPITTNGVDEITSLGPTCFKNWQEAANIIDRTFLLSECYDRIPRRAFTEPFRCLKYKVDKKKKGHEGEDVGEEEEEEEEEEDDEDDDNTWS
ncbi:nucleoredoxin-like protein 1 [Latimeria chalumnae]|uniref:Nucleoredoxin like 1 n=1 Tax=Latimeria chalumnae TaxID=7897 RepID=H3BCN9_LATCH|nr:PREDICTED: nucleoredoxin-like protein 1 [Latimeria chalumnae]|eukprot:XP_005991862.1 PREDICTED: nucleoredoxin-like protein 1 [Latimeria chalumnae]